MIKSQRPLFVGVGEILWDLLPTGKTLGGATTNFVWHAEQLGGDGIIVSAIGADTLGDEILQQLKEKKLDSQFISIVPSLPTGTVSVDFDAAHQPQYTIHQPVAWDQICFTPEMRELAKKADVVAVGSLVQRSETSQKAIYMFLTETREDCLRIYDINLRQNFYSSEIIEKTALKSQLLKLNHEEWAIIYRMFGFSKNPLEGLRQMLDRFQLEWIAMTRGEKGSLIITGEQSLDHPGYSVEVVDPIGAGDSFTAALAYGIVRGVDLSKAQDHASRIASYVCSQSGATLSLPEALRF